MASTDSIDELINILQLSKKAARLSKEQADFAFSLAEKAVGTSEETSILSDAEWESVKQTENTTLNHQDIREILQVFHEKCVSQWSDYQNAINNEDISWLINFLNEINSTEPIKFKNLKVTELLDIVLKLSFDLEFFHIINQLTVDLDELLAAGVQNYEDRIYLTSRGIDFINVNLFISEIEDKEELRLILDLVEIYILPPDFTHSSGEYYGEQQVTLSNPTKQGMIFFTIGEEKYPVNDIGEISGNEYIDPLLLNPSNDAYIIRAVRKVNDKLSEMVTIELKVYSDAEVVSSHLPGTYEKPLLVKLSSQSDTKIYYSLDGSTPDSNSLLYDNNGIPLVSTTTVKAVAVKDGVYGPVSTFEYKLFPSGGVKPQILLDKLVFNKGETVKLSVSLDNVAESALVENITCSIGYDSGTFELLTGDPDADILNESLELDTKIVEAGKISVTSHTEDGIILPEGIKLFTVYLKVKEDGAEGTKNFTVDFTEILDVNGLPYLVNNGSAVTEEVIVGEAAVIEGYVELFFGELGTGINSYLLQNLNQAVINETMAKLQIALINTASGTRTEYSGDKVFKKDNLNNFGTINNGRVTGHFKILAEDLENDILEISGSGYKKETAEISLRAGEYYQIATQQSPLILYPGDLGYAIPGEGLVNVADGEINTLDFSVWLKTFCDSLAGNAAEEDMFKADLSKDSRVNNLDFSLWLASYRKVLTLR